MRQTFNKSDIIQNIFSLIDERRWSIAGATRLMSEEEQWKYLSLAHYPYIGWTCAVELIGRKNLNKHVFHVLLTLKHKHQSYIRRSKIK